MPRHGKIKIWLFELWRSIVHVEFDRALIENPTSFEWQWLPKLHWSGERR
jgi:hypothetical protein